MKNCCIGDIFFNIWGENAYSRGVYKGFVVAKDNILVPLLQFADDTLIFSKYDEKMFGVLLKTVDFFTVVYLLVAIPKEELFGNLS